MGMSAESLPDDLWKSRLWKFVYKRMRQSVCTIRRA